jgi:hypothetical protein
MLVQDQPRSDTGWLGGRLSRLLRASAGVAVSGTTHGSGPLLGVRSQRARKHGGYADRSGSSHPRNVWRIDRQSQHPFR